MHEEWNVRFSLLASAAATVTPIQHLSWSQPRVSIDGLLRDVCQHGVCTAEAYHGSLTEEDSLLPEHVGAAQDRREHSQWDEPDREPHHGGLESGRRRWTRATRHAVKCERVILAVRLVRATDEKAIRKQASTY